MEISDIEIHPEYLKYPDLTRGFDIALCKVKFKDGSEMHKLALPQG